MKKNLIILVSVIGLLLCTMPIKVSAVEFTGHKDASSVSNSQYGQVKVSETGWTDNPDSPSGKSIEQIYTVTKTNASGYVAITFKAISNVEITKVTPGSSFEIAGGPINGTKEVTYIFKLKSGTSLSAATEVARVQADILVNEASAGCNLSYGLLSLECYHSGDQYFDNNGKKVSESEWNTACGNTTPAPTEVPESPQTGSVIPYVAIGGGLVAIICVYLFSRKRNKMYKL